MRGERPVRRDVRGQLVRYSPLGGYAPRERSSWPIVAVCIVAALFAVHFLGKH